MNDAADAPSPFSRPGFLVAAVAVAGVILLAVVLLLTDEETPEPVSEPAGSTAPSSAAPADEPSVCGLEGEVTEGRLTSAPEVDAWEYQVTVPYPVSADHGPGAVTDEGVRHCYQRSPEGALYAASNALAQATDGTVKAAFAEHFVAPGGSREQLLAAARRPADPDVRFAPAGFRLLSYDGGSARVEIAATAVVDGDELYFSLVYPLIWRDGDWKLDSGGMDPGSMAEIPDAAGYIPWGVE
ncbi:hypothetical protein [Myceligenerans crystallogenes]|uniref:DUF8175 domain-containing protein n=1 Tax=Myceligenerans crystallogenes TaxID=316335 RepID=A0ABN2NDZ9_9MICO